MGRFSLRVKTLEEFERFKKIVFEDEIAKYLFRDVLESKLNSSYVKEKDLNDDFICYLITKDNHDIGIAAGHLFRSINKMVVDIGILPEWRGKFSKEAVDEVLKDFYSDINNKKIEILAYVKKENERSLKFSKKFGFELFKKVNGNSILRFKNE